MLADIVECRSQFDKGGARRGRHAGAAHHLFCVGLGRLEPRRRRCRSEHGTTVVLQQVGEPGGERRFGTDDDQIDVVRADGGANFVERRSRDVEIGGDGGGARVARRSEQCQVSGRRGGVATQCPAQSMLAAAASDDQYSHLFLNASVNAWAARLAVSTTSFTTAFASFM